MTRILFVVLLFGFAITDCEGQEKEKLLQQAQERFKAVGKRLGEARAALNEIERKLERDEKNEELTIARIKTRARVLLLERLARARYRGIKLIADGDTKSGFENENQVRVLSYLLDHDTGLESAGKALRGTIDLRKKVEPRKPFRDLSTQIASEIELRKKLLHEYEQMKELFEGSGDLANLKQLELAAFDERVSNVVKLHHRMNTQSKLVRRSLQLLLARKRKDRDRSELLEVIVGKLRRQAKALSEQGGMKDVGEAGEAPIAFTDGELKAFAQSKLSSEVLPLLKKHCFGCHGTQTQEAELNLVKALAVTPIVKEIELWKKVIAHVKGRVMPPRDEASMGDDERRLLAGVLEYKIKFFDYSTVDNPGFEHSRRLTHTEYGNTIRDLLDTDIQPTARFPSELAGTSGFDNSGNTLFLHRQLMERYIGAAESVVEYALVIPPRNEQQKRSVERLFFVEPSEDLTEDEAAKKIINRFLTRAFRRQPTAAELDAFHKHFKKARHKENFHQAIRSVVQIALVSPKFLLRYENWKPGGKPFAVSQYDLASRLSYFLWASMPDDELLHLASQGKLKEAAVLREQVTRMLADKRCETMGTEFAAQWLGSQHLGVRIRPDPIDNPWCTDSLMLSLKAETAAFFHSLVNDNAPVARLVDADYTFLNAETAKHYGIKGIVGPKLRRVTLNDPNRGGIFGQGALLAVTSFPGRTSPVVRGKWILSDVLGTPPPPPPPNVSEFSREVARKRFLTQRQKLQLHRKNPNCYSCHSQIDPLGFSLEGFDWFGRNKRRSRGRIVDVRGTLPNGTEFEGPQGLKRVVVEQRLDDLARQITRKLLSYGLGRQLEYYDEPAIRKILASTKKDGYRIADLIVGIVTSYPFQYKKNPP